MYVHKFSISMGGKTLFDDCKLSLAYGRRYGLIGAPGRHALHHRHPPLAQPPSSGHASPAATSQYRRCAACRLAAASARPFICLGCPRCHRTQRLR